MTITKTVYVERVLLVLNEDGTLKAAHQERMEVLKEDGKLLHRRQYPAEVLAADALVGVLADRAALLAQIDALEKQLADAPHVIADLQTAMKMQLKQISALLRDNSDLQSALLKRGTYDPSICGEAKTK